jgi:hypothetical protein
VLRRPTEGIDLLGKIVGVEKGLFFLVVETVWESGVGRARVAYGREVELAQFALPRQQTTPNKPDPMGFLVNVIQPKSMIIIKSPSTLLLNSTKRGKINKNK